jgi:hypothetical protein
MRKTASHILESFRESRFMAILGRVGRWTLLVVVLSFALVGFLHVTRGTAVRHVRGVAADGVAISVAEQEFPVMASMATGAWLAPGNRVDVIENGDGTFRVYGKTCARRSGRSRCSCTTARPVVWRTRSARSCVTEPRPVYVYSSSTTPSRRWTSQGIIGTP